MKKWVILILVILGGLLLALQYVARRNEKAMVMPARTAPSEQQGVALPASSTNYASSDMAMSGDSNSYQSSLFLPAVQSSYIGACQGGALEEMRRTHGRYWGVGSRDAAFNFDETMKMYELVGNYVGCVAVARQNLSLCDTLPEELSSDSKKVDSAFTPRQRCREQAANMLFEAYMAGKVSDPVYCQTVVSYWLPENSARISVADFCKAAAGGMKSAGDYLAQFMPSKYKSQRDKAMPPTRSACAGDDQCLAIFDAYTAVMNGNADACPRSSNGYCEAAITRVTAPCEGIVREMSKDYCSYVERVKKASGGYIGMSKEEIKTYSAQQSLKIASEAAERQKKAEAESQQRNEAERQRKANDKMQEEMNKQVKKLLGKQ